MAKVRARSDNKRLFFDFYYLGYRFREQTLLCDNKENRKKLEKVMKQIEAEIIVGTFIYPKYFPGSQNILKVEELKAQEERNEVSRHMYHRVSGMPVDDRPKLTHLSLIYFGVAGSSVQKEKSHKAFLKKRPVNAEPLLCIIF